MKCEHIETGAKGIIKKELKATNDFPDQWGIYWLNDEDTRKALKGRMHYYWNDKDKIRIINNFFA